MNINNMPGVRHIKPGEDKEQVKQDMMDHFRNLMAQEMNDYYKELDTPTQDDQYWLVFYDDRGNREDCSVFYSHLVLAKSRPEAINKVVAQGGRDFDDYDARPMALIQ